MASVEFHHGTRVFQSNDEPVIVQLRDTSTIGLVIPVDPDDIPAGFAVNVPALITRPSEAANLPTNVKEELDSIFDQIVTKVILVMVDEGADAAATTTAMVGDVTTKTGVHALLKATSLGLPRPKLIPMAGYATPSAPDGIASVAVGVGGTGYSEETTTITVAGSTGGTGAVLKPVIGDGGAITSIAVVKPGYGYQGTITVTINDTGDGADATATATAGATLNPILAEMAGVAEKLRAFVYADGPDSSTSAALAARLLIGNRRIGFCDPRVLKSIGGVNYPRAASTIFAALQAKMDKEQGAVYAGSNVVINGIVGTNRPVEYGEEADVLNAGRVNTIINRGSLDGAGGFRAWGVWTCAGETIWQFIPVVRVTDLVNESIELGFLPFVDRPQRLLNLDLAVMAGQRALRGLENDGFLLPGSEFYLSEGQTPEEGVQGIVKFIMKLEVPAPMVDIRITGHRNYTVAYELLYDAVTGQVAIGQLL